MTANAEGSNGKKDEPKRLVTLSMFDSKAKSEAGLYVELEELGPDDDGKPYFIRIMGMDAAPVVKKNRRNTDKLLTAIRSGREAADTAESERKNIETLAASTLEWHLPPVEVGEDEPTLNEHNARRLYSDERFRWIVRKLTKKQNDESSFFVASSPS